MLRTGKNSQSALSYGYSANMTDTENQENMPKVYDESGFRGINPRYSIILFYQYTQIKDPEGFMNWHKKIGPDLGLTGRVHIATEGINATVEGPAENIQKYIALLREQNFADLKNTPIKISPGTGEAFPKLKAKVKPEIVALKLKETVGEDVDPTVTTGVHLKPEELKKWYENGEDFVVIDMRNDYEFRVGHFKDSINAGLKNFRDLPEMLPKILEKNPEIKGKKIVTVCTGGIRCEKASGYLMKTGLENVYQLDGGMHMYMDKFPGKGGDEFQGSLYTFDNRMTMDFAGEIGDGFPVAIDPNDRRDVIGECQVCLGKTERYGHCANDICHAHLLICEECAKNHIYVWCSKECKENGRIGPTPTKEIAIPGIIIAA